MGKTPKIPFLCLSLLCNPMEMPEAQENRGQEWYRRRERKKGSPKSTWRKTTELQTLNHNWKQAAWLVKDHPWRPRGS